MALSKILPASQEQYVGARNLIINGSMQVAQRGTSFTSSSVNEYSLDRWRTEGYALSTVISQQSFTAGQTDVPDFPTNYVRVTTNAAIPSGQNWSFQQRIEKPQAIPVGTQNFTLSFWAKSVSGTISATAFSFGISGDKVDCPEITTSWQKITTTINRAVNSSNAYESIYLVYLGSGKAAISIDIANVQLEIGDVATPFEHESYGDTLLKCQRYFEICGWVPRTDNLLACVDYKVEKRAQSTIAVVSSDSAGFSVSVNELRDSRQGFYQSANASHTTRVTMSSDAEL